VGVLVGEKSEKRTIEGRQAIVSKLLPEKSKNDPQLDLREQAISIITLGRGGAERFLPKTSHNMPGGRA